jgi:GNAT superfamily N-acetyltransferase
VEPIVTVTDVHDTALEAVVLAGLRDFNDALTGHSSDHRPLDVVVRDPATGAPLGGVLAHSSRGLLFVDLVYLPDALRGSGTAARMMTLAEDEAKRRGCTAAVLYSLNRKATEFYARIGYREFGRVAVAPPGSSRIYMSKSLG